MGHSDKKGGLCGRLGQDALSGVTDDSVGKKGALGCYRMIEKWALESIVELYVQCPSRKKILHMLLNGLAGLSVLFDDVARTGTGLLLEDSGEILWRLESAERTDFFDGIFRIFQQIDGLVDSDLVEIIEW